MDFSGSESLVMNVLSQDAFIMVNKNILRYLKNTDAALLLSELISLYKYHYQNKSLIFPDMIPIPYRRIEYNTALSKYKISSSLKDLEDKGIIETKVIGYPQIKHCSLTFEVIASILNEEDKKKKEKKAQKESFYETINNHLNTESMQLIQKHCKKISISNYSIDDAIDAGLDFIKNTDVFDKMDFNLIHTITITSSICLNRNILVNFNGEIIGKLKSISKRLTNDELTTIGHFLANKLLYSEKVITFNLIITEYINECIRKYKKK